MSGPWQVHCDGGCWPNPGHSGFGTVVIDPDGVVTEYSGYLGLGTNNTAEITAMIRGLEATPPGSGVIVCSDSRYVVDGITKWVRGWLARDWLTRDEKPVANKELWLQLLALKNERRLTVRWVRGHNGDRWNERCDELASAAVASRGVAQPEGQRCADCDAMNQHGFERCMCCAASGVSA